MKKVLLIIGLIFLITGCTNINELTYDEIIQNFGTESSRTNTYRTGYKYYLPRGMQVNDSTLFNEILDDGKNTYYLYVDVVSYINQVKYDYITGKCAPVVDYYRKIDVTGISLSNREATMYISSLLECGGFNYLNIIKAFEGQIDYIKTIAYIVGVHDASFQQLDVITKIFDQATTICINRSVDNATNINSVDHNIATLCSSAGFVGTFINLSELVAGVSNLDNITISAQGFKTALEGVDINTKLDVFLSENPLFISEITNTMNVFVNLSSKLEKLTGEDLKPLLEKYTSYLYDENKKISRERLHNFLTLAQSGAL